MTINELIEELSKHDPDKEVWLFGPEGEELSYEVRVYENENEKVYLI